MIRLIEVTDNAVIFEAVIRRCVPTIPQELDKLVEQLCKKHGLSVRDVTGNFEVIRFELNQYISEQQALDISNWIGQNNK